MNATVSREKKVPLPADAIQVLIDRRRGAHVDYFLCRVVPVRLDPLHTCPGKK